MCYSCVKCGLLFGIEPVLVGQHSRMDIHNFASMEGWEVKSKANVKVKLRLFRKKYIGDLTTVEGRRQKMRYFQ